MAISEKWLSGARAIAGDRVITDPEAMEPYGHDEFAMDGFRRLPEAVVKPADEGETAAIVRLCHKYGVPVTARGGGTGLSAGCVPSPGGVVLSLELLNRVVEADAADRTITVQAGLTLKRLYEAVGEMGLYFPPHPGDEGAFAGGAVAANAGGARAVKYGTVRRFVLGLQVVLADGRVLELGGRFIKSSSGYDLLDLMIGSEGTLGIVTRVTFGLLPPVGSVQTLIAPFQDVQKAIEAVPAMMGRGIIPCAVEFVEHSVVRCAERLLKKTWPATGGTASLMIILDGRNEDDTMGQAEAVGGSLEESGALDVLLTDDKAKQAEILELRSMLYESLRPATAELLDICVPRSRIAPHVGFLHELEGRLGVPLPTYGHAADGNVHTHLLRASVEDGVVGKEIPGWQERHREARDAIYADVISRGGVISGEHGIGLVKRESLPANLGAEHIAVMRSIKKALDPDGILNPGKIFA